MDHRHPQGNAPPNQAQAMADFVGGEAPGVLTVSSQVVGGFVKRHPAVSSLWVLGLVLALFATGLQVSQEAHDQYQMHLNRAGDVELRPGGLAEVQAVYDQASRRVYSKKVWFWRFRAEHRAAVEREQAKLDVVQEQLNTVIAERDSVVSDAKKSVGIFSTYGVQECRDLFWSSFEAGKKFAKDMTFYDVLFATMGSSRDEGLMGFLIKIIFQFLVNLTVGLLGALTFFAYALYGIVQSFRPDPLSAIVFFCVVLLSATSVVATVLTTLFGATAATGYVVVTNAMQNQAQLRDGRGGRQPYVRHLHRD